MVLTMKIRFLLKVKEKSIHFISNEEGSLAPLVIGLFIIASIVSLSIVDYSYVILKQRVLDQVNERAIQIAAHEIDLTRYYTHGLDEYALTQNRLDSQYRVPIDCAKAKNRFQEEFDNSMQTTSQLKSSQERTLQIDRNDWWLIESFTCDGNSISARVTQLVQLPFQLPILGVYNSKIHARAGAFSATK
jgi:hypothetical protein